MKFLIEVFRSYLKPVSFFISPWLIPGAVFSKQNLLLFLLKLNKALFVNKYLGPPGRYKLSLETPGAEIKSTYLTNVLGECSSLNKITLGIT